MQRINFEIMKSSFKIGKFDVGIDHPPFVIAEAGVHHFNSVELAKEYIKQARLAGVHAIKFQTYSAGRIAAKWAPTYWDDDSGRTQFDIFSERSLLSDQDYADLFTYAKSIGVCFLSTPFDPDAARLLDSFGMDAYKIASADITNHPLLEVVASFGKPVLMSTGASTFDEIRDAVKLVSSYNVPVSILHCNLCYPTALADANLARITALQNAFPDLIIGYSDHTQPQDSELACPLSVSLGARIIEKHYTLNKALTEDDHYHSVDQAGLCRLVENCRLSFEMTNIYQEMVESEMAARSFARRSIVATRDLKKGSIITEKDLDYKRPGTGLSPTKRDQVIGATLNKDIETDGLVQLEDVI